MPDLSWPDLSWMAWTWQTATFFAGLAAVLALMTGLAVLRPEVPRRGILQFPTTRGDRLFVTLLGAAVINLLCIAFTGDAGWLALLLSVVWAAAMFRWG